MGRCVLAGLTLLLAALVLTSAPAGAPAVVNEGHGDYVYVPAGAFRSICAAIFGINSWMPGPQQCGAIG